ncbi:MAG: YncE family protein [Cyclobacteriaceae bacterium]|nr:YncE family protein [Cyclobacteriaceae bacterium]
MKRLLISLVITICAYTVAAQNYYIYVTAESEDEVALVKFDGEKATTIKTIPVGVWPAEIEGPHGITVDPSGKYWYLSLAHGNPYGFLYKFKTGSDEFINKIQLGLFPASMQISTATGLLYCVNFNLHGDMIPSSVSVVDPELMVELTKVTTGVMPHGSRISPDGLYQYSVGMMSGELFEIDAVSLKVSRKLDLDKSAADMGMDHAAMGHTTPTSEHKSMDHEAMDHSKMKHTSAKEMKHSKVKPTWVTPHPNNGKAYIAANGMGQVLEVDLKTWKVTRKWDGGKGPYNIDITPDGKKLIVTYKTDGATGIWDVKKGVELARIPNTNKVAHGVAVSTDSKFAFISIEGKGDDKGRMDVINLETLQIVATAFLGKQAGGIAFWKQE